MRPHARRDLSRPAPRSRAKRAVRCAGSTRCGTERRRSGGGPHRLAVQASLVASLVTVGSVLVLGAATARADHDNPIPASADAAEEEGSQRSPRRTPFAHPRSADAAEHWLAGAAVAQDSRHPRVVRLSSPASTGTTPVDVGTPGQTVGDYLVFNHPVLNPAMTPGTRRPPGTVRVRRGHHLRGGRHLRADPRTDHGGGAVPPHERNQRLRHHGRPGAYRTAQGALKVRSTEERKGPTSSWRGKGPRPLQPQPFLPPPSGKGTGKGGARGRCWPRFTATGPEPPGDPVSGISNHGGFCTADIEARVRRVLSLYSLGPPDVTGRVGPGAGRGHTLARHRRSR